MWRTAYSSAASGIVVAFAGFRSLSGVSVALPCAEHGLELVNIGGGISVVDQAVGDALASVDDGGMVAASERCADVLQRAPRQVAGEVDRDLPWPGDPRGATGGRELLDGDVVVGADRLLDRADRDRVRADAWVDAVEHLGRERNVDRSAGQ